MKDLIIGILIFLLVVALGFIIYDKILKSSNNQSGNSDVSKYILKVYGNNYSICEKQDIILQ